MSRMLALLVVFALALTACTDTAEPDGPVPGGTDSPGAAGGNGGNGGNGGDGNAAGNQPPPEVEPSIPAEGESTTISVETLGQDTEPAEEISEPQVVLVRNESAGRAAAEAAPVPGAAQLLASWNRYAERALIAVYGGAQPDAGYTLVVDDVSVTRGGRHLAVFGAIRRGGGNAAQVVSTPWVVLSVPAGSVALAKKCFLTFEGQNTIQEAC